MQQTVARRKRRCYVHGVYRFSKGRGILKWALMRIRVPRTFINVVQEIYDGSCTRVKSMCGETENFRVRVGQWWI